MSNPHVALITGGSRGIGLGIAAALAAEGCDLAIMGRRAATEVAPVLEQLRGSGADVVYCRGDVADRDSRQQVLAAVREHFGRLNILINNAGVTPKVRADLLDATEDSYDWVMHINLKGPYFLTQAVARWMVAQHGADADFTGCIVNISSISATVASPNRGEYCISKAGLSMATQLWAVRLAEFGIPVYEIRPGITKTDMTAGVQAKYDRLIAEGVTLQPRWGYPEDVGKAVAALVRGDFAYSTGQIITVDGGLTVPRL